MKKLRYKAEYFLGFWGVRDRSTDNVEPMKSKDAAKTRAKELNDEGG